MFIVDRSMYTFVMLIIINAKYIYKLILKSIIIKKLDDSIKDVFILMLLIN